MLDRRAFMIAMGAACVAATRANAAVAGTSPRIDGLGGLSADGLANPNGFTEVAGHWVPMPTLEKAIRSGALTAVSQTVGPVGNGPDRFQQTVMAIARVDRLIAENSTLLTKIKSAADIRSAQASRKLGIIYNLQDSTALESDLSRIGLFSALGLRVMQITYNVRNLAGDGCLETGNGGISEFGREMIATMNTERVLLDLSHAGPRTMMEAVNLSRTSPVITHTGCRALVDRPRNTPDIVLRAVAEKGGVVGIFLMPFLRLSGQPQREDFLRHLDHAVNVAGEDHVSIGTDSPLMGVPDDAAARAAQRAFYTDRARRGIAAPGEAADVLNMVDGYNSIDRMDLISADLAAFGWRSGRIEKVTGGNLLRLFESVWGE